MRSRRDRPDPARRGRVALLCLLALVPALPLWQASPGAGQAGGTSEPVAQPVLGLPDVGTFVDASPGEADGEVWAFGNSGRVVRHTDAGGWTRLPPPTGIDGEPLSGFAFARAALAGRATRSGGVVVAGTSGTGSNARQQLIVRDPGGAFRQAPTPAVIDVADPEAPNAVLRPGETLFTQGSGTARVLVAARDEPGGDTGAYVVPARAGTQDGVLRFGDGWTREPICVPATSPDPADNPCPASTRLPTGSFTVLGVDVSSAGDAWLLARTGSTADGVVLFSRDISGAAPVWRQRSLGGSPFAVGSPQMAPGVSVRVEPRSAGQPLTATDEGVWVDVQLTIGAARSDATLLYEPDATGLGGRVVASWCDVSAELAALCTHPLGSELPAGEGRSFAWTGGGPYGRRVITGVGAGAILSLQDEAFVRVATAGGDAGETNGAAFSGPDEGWLGYREASIHYTRNPQPNRVEPWPVPFRRPLTAIAPEPGRPVGALGSQALAAGDRGQIARYVPDQGWTPEFLLSASGARATPRLRGVAWPEPSRAHVVGDGAEMWLWRSQTGLWEPDPAKPPNLALVNFTGIAFDPADPNRGYAIGKQGLLLRYGRQWTQESLPPGLEQANFTSIAFAGRQALVTYKSPLPGNLYEGGLLVNDGSGWRVDASAPTALAKASETVGARDVPERVAGLPDGGAAVAGLGGGVVVRDSASGGWRTAGDGRAGNYPTALAAIREGGKVRAVISVEAGVTEGSSQSSHWPTDSDQIYGQPPPGQAPLVTPPYPLPGSGHVLRETAAGWRDEQHEAYPRPASLTGSLDWPMRPDAVLALALDATGSRGWAVGGETGELSAFKGDDVQTAGVMRYPADGAPSSVTTSVPIGADAGKVIFAIGGNAQCAAACSDLANVRIGPDRSLPNAIARAAGIAGVRAFVHTGPGVARNLGSTLGQRAFARESANYARRLSAAAGPLPVFAAPAASDLDGSGSLATFTSAFAGFGAPLGAGSPGPGITPLSAAAGARGYYSFDSGGAGGMVRVIVLDYSAASIGDPQRCWLASELAAARAAETPAIVVGNRDISAIQGSSNPAADAAAVARIVVTGTGARSDCQPTQPGGASAYFFDYPEQNRTYPISALGRSIPSFGSGTLGYVSPPGPRQTDFVGASGFLLAEVDVARRDPATNVAPVTARLIPSIADLALNATDGTLLRRSQPALFEALARRPAAGMRAGSFPTPSFIPDPYVPIPAFCRGVVCASALFPEYRFESSNPDIADFVRSDQASPNPRSVLLGRDDKPILDASSGLLCAFNAGTTNVRVTAGGLSYSQKVTVQKGSVQRPCGTTPLRNRPRPPSKDPNVPPPPFQPAQPAFEGGATPLPPPPAPAAAPPAPAPTPSPVPIPYLFIPPIAGVTQVPVAVPPPAPSAARPSPPSGTSSAQVYQNAVAPQRQREVEEAIDLVHHMAAYGHSERGPLVPAYVPALVLMLAFAGSGIRRSRRARRGRELAYVNSSRPPRRQRRSRR